MGISPKKITWVVDGALRDTGSNILFSVGIDRLPATSVSDMHNFEPIFNQEIIHIAAIGSSIQIVGTLEIYFQYRVKLYSVYLNIFTGSTPLTISHKDLDEIE